MIDNWLNSGGQDYFNSFYEVSVQVVQVEGLWDIFALTM